MDKRTKIVVGRGPMSDELERRWGVRGGYWQAYDWTIYCVQTPHPPFSVIEHEEIHFRQQEKYPGGVVPWWERYLDDAEFRLEMEAEAYGNDVKQGYRGFSTAVWTLTGKLYGNLPEAQVANVLRRYCDGS